MAIFVNEDCVECFKKITTIVITAIMLLLLQLFFINSIILSALKKVALF